MKLLLSIIVLCTFIGCRKEFTETKNETKPRKEKQFNFTETLTKLDYMKMLATTFLESAEESVSFKQWIYTTCHAQDSGDYYISVKNLLQKNEEESFAYWDQTIAGDLQSILESIEEMEGEEFTDPIVFVPFLEDINLDSLINESSSGAPEAVISMEYDTTTKEAPGYYLHSEDGLEPLNLNFDEDYAWSHDVWVFGQEERVSTGNMVSGSFTNSSGHQSRTNGQQEKGGILQVTDLGKLEAWTNGKLEFRYSVFNATGTKIKERFFGKVKRKEFKNNVWKDFDDFIAYWNTANIGNWMIEVWIEEDGGNSTVTNSTTFPSPCTGCPSTTISTTRQYHDFLMGQVLIQFTDPITTVYNLTYANIKRKN